MEGVHVFLASFDERTVGLGIATLLDEISMRFFSSQNKLCSAWGEAHMSWLAVEPEFWSKGVGKALVNYRLVWAAKAGCEWAYMSTSASNARAVRIVQEFGFKEYAKAYSFNDGRIRSELFFKRSLR